MASKKKVVKDFIVVPSGEGIDEYGMLEGAFIVKDKADFLKQLEEGGEMPEVGDKPWTYDVYVLNSSISVKASALDVDDPDHVLDGDNW
jgi:hypothetical protein